MCHNDMTIMYKNIPVSCRYGCNKQKLAQELKIILMQKTFSSNFTMQTFKKII